MVSSISRTVRPSVNSIEDLLLSYITAAMPGRIPGCDGMTTQHMLQGYAELASKGFVPDCQQLLRWHPHLATELEQFFGKSAWAN